MGQRNNSRDGSLADEKSPVNQEFLMIWSPNECILQFLQKLGKERHCIFFSLRCNAVWLLRAAHLKEKCIVGSYSVR